MTTASTTLTTQEIASFLGVAVKNVLARAEREGWQFVPRSGRGGGKRWLVSSAPKETRKLIASGLLRQQSAAAHGKSLCASIGTSSNAAFCKTAAPAPSISYTPAPAAMPLFPGASDRERAVATARLAFVREIERISAIIGKEGAIRHLVDCSRLGNLPSILMDQISTATACKRGGALTRRTLYRWMADYTERGEAGLLPSQSKIAPTPAWFDEFLHHFQKPQHPSVAFAYSEFCKELAARGESNPPSIHAVRRLLSKMSAPAREAGRATGNALLKLRPYQRRDTSELWPGDVYTADGTTFDAEVLHPDHGQPFKPEITAIIDVATRRCVGISIALSESALTVLDALRMACLWAGIPAMFYSDSGPGYDNKLLLNDRTGMFQRLGITPCNAIPGRPQGKGLMERAVKTLWVWLRQAPAFAPVSAFVKEKITMYKIEVNLDTAEVKAALSRLQRAMSDTTPLMMDLAQVMAEASDRAFETETDPVTGAKWPKLNPDYKRQRTEAGHSRGFQTDHHSALESLSGKPP